LTHWRALSAGTPKKQLAQVLSATRGLLMLEITTQTGDTVYISPSHVVVVTPDSTGRFAKIVMADGQVFEVKASAMDTAAKVSNARGETIVR
jgi:hypothetical protein